MASPPFAISTSDRALLLAVRGAEGDPSHDFWASFAPTWRVALRSAWEETFRRIGPQEARRSLVEEHRDEAMPDPAHVHPTWYVRALRDESPAVRLAVIAHVGEPIATTLRSAFGADLPATPSGPAHPEALAWVLSFWTERLVGGPPPSPMDPPAIRATAELSPSSLQLLLRDCGQRKLGGASTESREFDDAGLSLLGRLLSHAEAFRVRWALQHLPYDFAKRVRGRIVASPSSVDFEEDNLIFEAASETPRGPRLRGEES